MIAIPGFSTPTVGADAPLELLSACHARIERQCATLLRLAVHLAAHGIDDEARQAATSVMRYFDLSAPNHHADEEQDLFPALLESVAGSDAQCLRALIDGLSAEHRALEALWRRVPGLPKGMARCGGRTRWATARRWSHSMKGISAARRTNCCRWRHACSTTKCWQPSAGPWPSAGDSEADRCRARIRPPTSHQTKTEETRT